MSPSDGAGGAPQCLQRIQSGAEQQLRPTEDENPLTAPIQEAIALAEDAHVLLFIDRAIIPHCIGILDDERAALKQAVRDRHAALNAEAGYGANRIVNPIIVREKNFAAWSGNTPLQTGSRIE